MKEATRLNSSLGLNTFCCCLTALHIPHELCIYLHSCFAQWSSKETCKQQDSITTRSLAKTWKTIKTQSFGEVGAEHASRVGLNVLHTEQVNHAQSLHFEPHSRIYSYRLVCRHCPTTPLPNLDARAGPGMPLAFKSCLFDTSPGNHIQVSPVYLPDFGSTYIFQMCKWTGRSFIC